MTPEIVSVVLTGAGVLLGVWRIQAHYETRKHAAHTELRAAISRLDEHVRTQGERLARLEGKLLTVLGEAYGD